MCWVIKVVLGLIGVMVLKKWKFQVNNFLDLLKWIWLVFVFNTMEIKCILFWVVEVIRLYFVFVVVFVFMLLIFRLLFYSRWLWLGWWILLKVNFFFLWMVYFFGILWINVLFSNVILCVVLNCFGVFRLCIVWKVVLVRFSFLV